MLRNWIIEAHAEIYSAPLKPDISLADGGETEMKTLIRVALTAFSLTFGIAHAATPSHHAPVQQGSYYNFLEGGGG